MPRMREIAVVVTGSVAAVKTFLLAEELRKQGLAPRFVVTQAAWPFLHTEGKYKPTPGQLAELDESSLSFPSPPAQRAGGGLSGVDAILIAPASADFIRQAVLGDTPLGAEIKNSGRPVLIAPAMNVMMWQHPAVQKNVRAALAMGMHLLGPASGGMACGDSGYGRMIEPRDIAAAARAVLDGGKGPAPAGLVDAPRLPTVTRKPCKKILLVAGTEENAVHLMNAGFDVQCVVAPGAPPDALRKLTGRPVVWQHHQLYPRDGMEHIWLAEDSDAVVLHLSPSLAAEMAKGAAESFIGCVYLASKRPVILVPAPGCADADIKALRAHGAFVTDEKGVVETLRGLGGEADLAFSGKAFLVLGGSPRETVDSFRFYANAARPQGHGREVAEELTARGAEVTLLEAAGSARALLEACGAIKGKEFEAVLQLANIAQFTCPAPVAHKIGKRGAERAKLFEVEGNVDVFAGLREIFGAGRVIGYNNHQEWTDDAATPLKPKIASLIRRAS